eukprot:m.10007 g.10007  ORF g.10007 m.10007 type:complete len:284 (-) comp7312_c0_seq2:156-1007(-)
MPVATSTTTSMNDTNEKEKCHACEKNLKDSCLKALNRKYHPECLKCHKCQTQLENLPFVANENEPFCEPCYHEAHGKKCFRCKKVILPNGTTGKTTALEAGGNSYHEDCFKCKECSKKFESGEKKGPYPFEGELHCYDCASAKATAEQEKTAPKCYGCERGIFDTVLKALGQKYHPKCFVCHICKQSLEGKPFIRENEQPYCETCHQKGFTQKCARCNKVINPGGDGQTVIVKAGGDSFHSDCYTCETCNLKFGDDERNSAYQVFGHLYCLTHAKEAKKKDKQ